MNITKHEHACLDIREGGSRLIIDPGIFSVSLKDLANIDVVVVTHMHGDHFDPEKLEEIVAKNPDVRIFTTSQVKNKFSKRTELVKPNQKVSVAKIELKFFGKQHHLFNDIENVGVLINKQLYYPGDSYTTPDQPVKILAMPASAPWFRIDEASDFLSNVKPVHVFPTHNALLSEIGESIHYRILSNMCVEVNAKWHYLKPDQSFES